MSDEFKFARFEALSEMNRDELALLATFIVAKTFKDGEEIISKDSKTSNLMFIFSGKVKIYRTFPNGGTFAQTINANEIFGEVAFIDQQGRSASGVAVGATEIGMFDYEHFEVIKKQDPVFGMKLLLQISKLLAGKVRSVNNKLDTLLGQIL